MRPLLAIAVAGCAAAPPHPATPTSADIAARSHAAIEAFDRGDATALDAALAPAFVRWESGEPAERAAVLEKLRARKPGAPHIGSRTWSHEHVYVHADDALFIGEAAEHMAGNDAHGGYEFDGWYSLSWRREPATGAWRVAFWTWKEGGARAERDRWNEIFRHGVGFEHQPNRLLVDAVAHERPGDALDVAMGQGRNALYLAAHGWRVTGVDYSDEGVKAARESAAAQHLALDAVNADVDTYDFGVAKWDLVTLVYAGNEAKWIAKVKPSLRAGGLVVVEYFHKDMPTMDGFATGELAADFRDGFEILRDDVVDDVPDWAMDRAKLVRFVARKR